MRRPRCGAVAGLLLAAVACSDATDPDDPADRVASLTIEATWNELYSGETDQLTFEARDEAGAVVSGVAPQWMSSDTAVATISATGAVLARKAGTVVLSGGVGEATDALTLEVSWQPAALTVDTQPSVLTVEDTIPLGIAVLDSSGAALVSPRLLIHTSDSAVAHLTTDGRLITTGGGNATITLRAFPHSVVLPLKVVEFNDLSAGDAHTCARTTALEIYCWGYNLGSQLGDSSNVPRNFPAPVRRAPGALAIVAAGGEHSCALGTNSATYCWGFGGTGSTDVQPTPTLRPAPNFASLSAGRYMSCGLTAAGEAQCWGHRFWNGTTELLASPTPVPADVDFARVDVGREHSCGLDATGQAFCWGANDSEQLGAAGPASDSALAVPTADRFVDVAAGWRHSCGVISSGELRCWGVWPYSGNPPPKYRTVASPEPLVSVSTESEYTCGLSTTGKAYCMGRAYGLGNLFYPVVSMRPVLGDLRFVMVEAGSTHACGLTASGALYCWGYDYVSPGETWPEPMRLRPES